MYIYVQNSHIIFGTLHQADIPPPAGGKSESVPLPDKTSFKEKQRHCERHRHQIYHRFHSIVLTNACGLHVAFIGHAIPPEALVRIAARQAILHPVVCCCWHHQQDVGHKGTEQTATHKAVHPDTNWDQTAEREMLNEKKKNPAKDPNDSYLH